MAGCTPITLRGPGTNVPGLRSMLPRRQDGAEVAVVVAVAAVEDGDEEGDEAVDVAQVVATGVDGTMMGMPPPLPPLKHSRRQWWRR